MKVFGHFLQSETWEKFERAEGYRTLRVSGEGFRAMAVVHETKLGRYLFCPYGPELWQVEGRELEWSLGRALDSLVEAAKKEGGAMFVRVEPTACFPAEVLEKMGLKRSHELDPEHTWVIDLTCSQEDLLAGFEKSKVRTWKNAEKHGIFVRSSKKPEEVAILTGMLAKLGEERQFIPLDEEHFRKQVEAGFATLYIAEVAEESGSEVSDVQAEGVAGSTAGESTDARVEVLQTSEGDERRVMKPVAAAIVMDYEGTRYALNAAADDEYRKLRPGTVVGVEKIVDAQRQGLTKFDFWGITTSNDPKHPWYGFTQFKKSFKGEQVDYSGTWDLPIARVKYRIYLGLRAVNRMLRKRK